MVIYKKVHFGLLSSDLENMLLFAAAGHSLMLIKAIIAASVLTN